MRAAGRRAQQVGDEAEVRVGVLERVVARRARRRAVVEAARRRRRRRRRRAGRGRAAAATAWRRRATAGAAAAARARAGREAQHARRARPCRPRRRRRRRRRRARPSRPRACSFCPRPRGRGRVVVALSDRSRQKRGRERNVPRRGGGAFSHLERVVARGVVAEQVGDDALRERGLDDGRAAAVVEVDEQLEGPARDTGARASEDGSRRLSKSARRASALSTSSAPERAREVGARAGGKEGGGGRQRAPAHFRCALNLSTPHTAASTRQ